MKSRFFLPVLLLAIGGLIGYIVAYSDVDLLAFGSEVDPTTVTAKPQTPTPETAEQVPTGNSGNDLQVAALNNLAAAKAPTGKKPNILVIMPDDIGYWNISAYNRGVMGYRTPHIDRIAKEGALFTDQYAQPSCTPGRASFITGMYPIRSGLTTVGMVGAQQGMQADVPSLAEVLKQQGYATGQFGKNHLGDRNEHLPTVHGFDEFYGFLYHLNVLQEPLDHDYPRGDKFLKKFGPRGILHSFATDTYDKRIPDPRFGPIGKQTIVDTGVPDKKGFETLDTKFNDMAFKFMDKAVEDDKPFFIWLNPSRMHVFTFVPDEYKEKAREYTSYDDPHAAGMIQHDDDIGKVLDKLEALGIADNTIVVYATDNGPEHSTYPYGGTTPFRSEKMTNWEGGVRVPFMVRWPGKIQPGSELNGIQTLMDVFATLATAAGVDYSALRQRLMKGDTLGTDTVKKVYLDGVNNLDYWTGQANQSARDEYIYWSESSLQGIRVRQWKAHFAQRNGYYGTTVQMDIARIFNVRQDPFESFEQHPRTLGQLPQHKSWMFNTVLARLSAHLKTLKEFPPTQRGSSLSIDKMIDQMLNSHPSSN